jgi:hypothetical protein
MKTSRSGRQKTLFLNPTQKEVAATKFVPKVAETFRWICEI